MTVIAAADGSALGNPGPAGWAWYVDEDTWDAGGWPRGTNNMGELTAVLELLQQTADLDDDLLIYCDSKYTIDSIMKWMPGWKAKGWTKKDGKPVLNLEIMKALDQAMSGRRSGKREVRFEWVKGHSGHPLNEAADRLANAAAASWASGIAPDPGPGFTGTRRETESSGALQHPPEQDTPEQDAAEVIELECQLLSEQTRRDPEALDRLLHPAWREIGASGRLVSRAEVLKGLAPAAATLEVIEVSRPAPDVLMLLWRASSPVRGSSLRSSLWTREHGRWQQLFHQGTVEPG